MIGNDWKVEERKGSMLVVCEEMNEESGKCTIVKMHSLFEIHVLHTDLAFLALYNEKKYLQLHKQRLAGIPPLPRQVKQRRWVHTLIFNGTLLKKNSRKGKFVQLHSVILAYSRVVASL